MEHCALTMVTRIVRNGSKTFSPMHAFLSRTLESFDSFGVRFPGTSPSFDVDVRSSATATDLGHFFRPKPTTGSYLLPADRCCVALSILNQAADQLGGLAACSLAKSTSPEASRTMCAYWSQFGVVRSLDHLHTPWLDRA